MARSRQTPRTPGRGGGLLARLGAALGALFSAGRPTEAKKGGPAAEPPPSDGRQVQFESHLNNMLERNGSALTGKINWIGLEDYRARWGDRWDKIGPKVYAIARSALERRLGPGDTFSLYRGDYLIVFANLSPAEAELKCALIAKEISDKLLGEADAGAEIAMGSTVARIERSALARGQSAIEAAGATLGREAERRKSRRPTTAEAIAQAVTFVYEPLWNVRQRVVSTFRAVPVRVSGHGGLLMGDDVMCVEEARYPLPPRVLAPALDRRTLEQAIEDVREIAEGRARFVLAVPVHYLTLADPGAREDYLRLCRTVPEAHGRFLVFEILGVRDDVHHSNLFKAAMYLKPFCRAVMLQQPLSFTRFDAIGPIGFHSAGTSLAKVEGDETTLGGAIRAFAEGAHRVGLRSYICGARTAALASAAARAGYEHVGGETVTSLGDKPPGLHLFEIDKGAPAPAAGATSGPVAASEGRTASTPPAPASTHAPASNASSGAAIDPQTEFMALAKILRDIPSADQRKISNALDDMFDELSKSTPDREELGRALRRALDYARRSNAFMRYAGELGPHLDALTRWMKAAPETARPAAGGAPVSAAS